MSKKFEYGPDHDHTATAKKGPDSESNDQTQTKSGAKEDRGRDEKVIHKLETQMASSIHKLNTKISQLDDAQPASSLATRVTVGFGVMAAALIGAVMQLL
jgi:hypothetical protein